MAFLAATLAATSSIAQQLPDKDQIGAHLSALLENKPEVAVVLSLIEPGGTYGEFHGNAGHDTRQLSSESVFEIGSLGALFAGALLADMIEKGEVALEDSALEDLPKEISVPAGMDPGITFEDLATQPTDPALALLGTALANRVETSYEDLLRQRILDPLKLEMTGITMTEKMRDWLTKGHDDEGRIVPHKKTARFGAALGVLSTLRDLERFLEANMGHPRTDLEQVLRAGQESVLGWRSHEEGDRSVLYQVGRTKGYWAFLGFLRDHQIGLVLLSNSPASFQDFAMQALMGTLPEMEIEEFEDPTEVEEVVLPDLQRKRLLVGRYLFDPSTSLQVTMESDQLYALVNGRSKLLMEPFTQQDFVLENGWILRFAVAEGGKVDQVTVEARGMKRVFQREDK